MAKIVTTSEDIANENLDKLRRVFPQFVKDDEVDYDALKAFFADEKVLAGEEKYGLSWAGKSNAFRAIRTPATGTLTPQPEDSKNWDTTENIFIEGDNLEVLKLLQKHYRSQIKMIYIDPPYNTGKDFIYKDNFTQNVADYYEQTGQTKNGIKMTANTEKNGRYHSDWLTMMYPRLFLAHNLLRDDGVIFISIDDNEVHNLRMVMDEIFGEENFVGQLIIRSNPRGSQEPFGISAEHEYALCYGKSDQSIYQIVGYERDSDDEEFGFIDKNGRKARLLGLRKRGGDWKRSDRPNMFYPFYVNPKTNEVSLTKTDHFSVEVLPVRPEGEESRWTWGSESAKEQISNLIGKKVSRNGNYVYDIYRIDYLQDENGEQKTEKLKSILDDKELNYQFARQYLKEFFGSSEIFDFPKSPFFISKLIGSMKNKDGIILDFFAGSGTTAHAVFDLNAKDGGNRKWICIQLPEATDEKSEAFKAGYKNIAEISRERIRRAGDKIGKGDIGFKAFALQKSNYRQWNVLTETDNEEILSKQIKLFAEKPLVDNFDEKSVVYEILEKEGFDLNATVAQEKGNLKPWIATDGEKKLVVTFASKINRKDVEDLKLAESDVFVCLDSALDDTTKVNLERNTNMRVI